MVIYIKPRMGVGNENIKQVIEARLLTETGERPLSFTGNSASGPTRACLRVTRIKFQQLYNPVNLKKKQNALKSEHYSQVKTWP